MIKEYLEKKHNICENIKDYEKIVHNMLKKYNVKNIKDLSKSDKTKFFKELDSMWTSKSELKESFELWKKLNKDIITEQYDSKKRNINKDIYEKILFETFIIDKKVYDIDYPVDYETWMDLNKERLTQNFSTMESGSKDGRTFKQYCFDEFNMQLLPNWVWIDNTNVNKPANQQYWNKFD